MLISRIERFLREMDMPASTLGRLALRDPRFVEDLRNGREPRRRTEQRVEHFMNTHRKDTANAI